MFLRKRTRRKNGKTHRYWSVVESRRLPGNKTMQEHLLYLGELRGMKSQTRDDLLMRLGATKKQAGRAWSLVTVNTPAPQQAVTPETFSYSINCAKLRQVRRREGRYLLRSNMTSEAPEAVWERYLLLTQIEQAFKDLKGDLAIRPIFHQKELRIEAHIFVAFIAYCLQVTLRNMARRSAAGLTPQAIFEKLKTIMMIDVELPTDDGRRIKLSRHTEPEDDAMLVLHRLGLQLPAQPPPRIGAAEV